MVDTTSSDVVCVCYACSVLFDRPAASDGHYRLVGDRRARLGGIATAPLGVPVGLAFFVVQPDGRVLANYPSPAGATRWEVDGEAWTSIVAADPILGSLEPAVEALLVNTARGHDTAWILPVDDCYRLVARVRQNWTGISGGDQVWTEIDRFFDELEEEPWDESGSASPM
jgi:hypothetical protein